MLDHLLEACVEYRQRLQKFRISCCWKGEQNSDLAHLVREQR
jgi:hypothetical protein